MDGAQLQEKRKKTNPPGYKGCVLDSPSRHVANQRSLSLRLSPLSLSYINVRLHKPADQDPKALEKFTIYVMETGRLMIQPPVETACLIFDMTGFGLANMDYG